MTTPSEALGTEAFNAIPFSVDAHLLSELGERLVGRRHIALAELVKNSYDADAQKVIIKLFSDRIEIHDNGSGMSQEAFKKFWMRIGSSHKSGKEQTDIFHRTITGSKGVGRLSVQFLARELKLLTASRHDKSNELVAFVDWELATQVNELTQATVQTVKRPSQTTFPNNKKHGTILILSGLKHNWTRDNVRDLARELWMIQPPARFGVPRDFHIELVSELFPQAAREFSAQMSAVLDLWNAKIKGELLEQNFQRERRARIAVQFNDGEVFEHEPSFENFVLNDADYEIYIYDLRGKQGFGIAVQNAREYMEQYGGVRIYDNGFNLPYYNSAREHDWLGIEQDHAHRIHRSELLPDILHVPRALNDLPTNRRIYGAVFVSTARERTAYRASNHQDSDLAPEYLDIQITRDRLIENRAYENLRDFVRWGLDFYATRQRLRQQAKTEQANAVDPKRRAQSSFDDAREVIEVYKREIPAEAYREITAVITNVEKANQETDQLLERRTALLGSLAATGITALAFEHEIGQQRTQLKTLARNVRSLISLDSVSGSELSKLANQIDSLLVRFEQSRKLFSPLMDTDDRELEARMKAKQIVQYVYDQLGVLTRAIKLDVSNMNDSVRLPPGTLAEWSALFQNVFLNAVNAISAASHSERLIAVASRQIGRNIQITISDTGTGVAVEYSKQLFEPFNRNLQLPTERRELGLGGTGLGLTIVRMLANNRNCNVAFIKPLDGFKTTFRLSWREKHE